MIYDSGLPNDINRIVINKIIKNMKHKIFVLLFIFWASIISAFSQNIQMVADSTFKYSLGDKVISCTKMSIVNKSTDKLIIWLDFKKNDSQEANFKSYFFRRLGDFTLYNIIMEHGSTLTINAPKSFSEIFKTFYKILEPKECFDLLFIINEGKLQKSHYKYTKCLKGNLLKSISERELAKLNITIDEAFKRLSFKPQYIVINVDDLCNNIKHTNK